MIVEILAAAEQATGHWTEFGLVVGGILTALGVGGGAGVLAQRRRTSNSESQAQAHEVCPLHKGLETEIQDLKITTGTINDNVVKIMFHLMGEKK